MTWWKKGLLWSVVCVGLIITVGFAFDDALSDDAVSSICGTLGGVALVVIWVVAFLRRSSSQQGQSYEIMFLVARSGSLPIVSRRQIIYSMGYPCRGSTRKTVWMMGLSGSR